VPELLSGRLPAALRGQFERASLSIACNIAEGGRRFSPDQWWFNAITRPATEGAAPIAAPVARGLADP